MVFTEKLKNLCGSAGFLLSVNVKEEINSDVC